MQLQATILSKNSETRHIMSEGGAKSDRHGNGDSATEEEILSDSDDEDNGEAGGVKRHQAKESVTSASKRRCEEEDIAAVYEALLPYRDAVITKWNEKAKLASGKITSKVVDKCKGHRSVWCDLFNCRLSWLWTTLSCLRLNM